MQRLPQQGGRLHRGSNDGFVSCGGWQERGAEAGISMPRFVQSFKILSAGVWRTSWTPAASKASV